jgi:hypothetical protein
MNSPVALVTERQLMNAHLEFCGGADKEALRIYRLRDGRRVWMLSRGVRQEFAHAEDVPSPWRALKKKLEDLNGTARHGLHQTRLA